LPKRKSKDNDYSQWIMPDVLAGALRSLYDSYERSYRYWEANADAVVGETPPVFIVVCPNTLVSKLVYDWIAGRDVDVNGTQVHRSGNLALFSNTDAGRMLARPRTILIDSAQLESGDALKSDFKDAAAAEIA
jgi:type III restriction enzyme